MLQNKFNKRGNFDAEIWLDLLCWESIIKILLLYGPSIKNIYYCQASILFLPFKGIIQVVLKISLVQIQDFVFSEERTNNTSAYEEVNNRLKILLENIGDRWVQSSLVNDFAKKNNLNITKIEEYLKEAAFYYLYRPMELFVMAEIRSKEIKPCFILKKTPFSDILKHEFKNHSINFYRILFSHYFPIIKRKNYHNDSHAIKQYFDNKLLFIFIKWLRVAIRAVLATAYRNHLGTWKNNSQINIGVEQLQSRIRMDEINDMFWFEGSSIPPETIFIFNTDRLDFKSQKILSNYGVKRISRAIPFLPWFNRLFAENNNSYIYIAADASHIFRTFSLLAALIQNIVSMKENAWVHLYLENYKCQTLYWQNIYGKLNIKILWTMVDAERDKLAKSQALENLGGVYTGSHWSTYSFYHGLNQKYYDLFFLWGQHFVENTFTNYSYLGKFIVGYPSDHYFSKQSKEAELLRAKYSEKFIISYHDGFMADDVINSVNMHVRLYEMFIEILEENDSTILFLKPKRKFLMDNFLEKIPRLKELIENEKIVVFLGETSRTKAVPAMVGLASDLVVGLGISTAAAECYFSGTLAFHADLTGLVNNEFGNSGLNKFVFRDIGSLKRAILDVINNDGAKEKYLEHKEIYKMLDPFQDGMAYRRVGFVLKNLRESLDQGLSREEAIKVAQQRYKKFIHSQKMCVNEKDINAVTGDNDEALTDQNVINTKEVY